MKKILFTLTLLFVSILSYSQTYEIVRNPKVEQAFTIENIDSLEVKIETLRHNTDTVRYILSEWTTIKIHPRTNVGPVVLGIKEEEIK